jgi:c-di-GMP-related signal transduction protein
MVMKFSIAQRSERIRQHTRDIATAETLMNTFLTFGLSNLTHDKPAFINFDETVHRGGIALLFE